MSRLAQVREKSPRELYIEETGRVWGEKWEHETKELDPLLSIMGRERLARTLKLIPLDEIEGREILDLGCGSGRVSRTLQKRGGKVTAVDAVQDGFSCEKIPFTRAVFPYYFTSKKYSGIVFADVLAELPESLYRLSLSELSELLERDGWLLLSTPLDVRTENPIGHLISLLQTEFEIEEYEVSHHRLYLFIKRLSFFRPFVENKRALSICEKITRIFYGERGITHIILRLRKKSVMM